MAIDLHLHSNASDGQLSPSEVVRAAHGAGLTTIALCDHDSVEGIPEALASGSEVGVRVIPAVELSAASDDSRDCHILGYFIDPDDPTLRARLAELRDARRERAVRMVAALADAGYDISLDDVIAIAREGAVGRAHVARALVERGHAASVAEAFQRFIGRGGPFYVSKTVLAPFEVIALIRAAGGVAVLAHPGVSKVDDLVPGLVEAGLAGLEAYHAEHTPQDRARYAAWADDLGVVATGGSDYHGPFSANSRMGSGDVPGECLSALERAAGL